MSEIEQPLGDRHNGHPRCCMMNEPQIAKLLVCMAVLEFLELCDPRALLALGDRYE